MQPIAEFSLKPIAGPLAQSALLWRGDPVRLVVDGLELEQQFGLETGYLLLLTENCPYEEGLHIYLLDADRRMRDAIALGAPYAPALLHTIQSHEPAALTFSFFGNDQWRLTVRAMPRFDWKAAFCSPVMFKSGRWGRHWLDLRCIPATTTAAPSP